MLQAGEFVNRILDETGKTKEISWRTNKNN